VSFLRFGEWSCKCHRLPFVMNVSRPRWILRSALSPRKQTNCRPNLVMIAGRLCVGYVISASKPFGISKQFGQKPSIFRRLGETLQCLNPALRSAPILRLESAAKSMLLLNPARCHSRSSDLDEPALLESASASVSSSAGTPCGTSRRSSRDTQ
jgi:hypothetical protein